MQHHIIGTGRLGRSLSRILTQKSVPHTLHGRSFPTHCTGIVYICVSEHAIATVAKRLEYHRDVIVLHASGSLGLEVFPDHTANIGCLHPIQSFPGPEIGLPSIIPTTLLCGDKVSPADKQSIMEFAMLLGYTVHPFKGSRLAYHTAAVLSGNMTTVLFSLAKEVLIREGYSDGEAGELLYALADHSLTNAKTGSLVDVLTGPIARNQEAVLSAQHNALQWDSDIQELYKTFVKVSKKRL